MDVRVHSADLLWADTDCLSVCYTFRRDKLQPLFRLHVSSRAFLSTLTLQAEMRETIGRSRTKRMLA